ncbi:dephospho-CoA kinase [Gephyromycinifex aptenodytis]|uniref:dephospho-CoA kinase n=1 Tax=Gephyromycinifex aptenodytis TaxID=2716227 RepID=UPI001448544D|nr:dephospho-CoA kinase [Gephyromycinifex aptenodytis]
MLSVGLTGGIGSGKSTAARRLRELGAVVIDADAVAREVLAAGSEGLAEVIDRFGSQVLAADGALDRAALAGQVFGDEVARQDLERITHPRIAARTDQLLAAAGPGDIVVHDVPLLVEKNMGSRYHLVVAVDARPQTRVARAVERGMNENDVRARMAHQASDAARAAAADVLLDNNGSQEDLAADVTKLWNERLRPFEANLSSGTVFRRPDTPVLVEGSDWDLQANRLIERIGRALGERAPEIEHVGSTSVPGMRAKDVIDIQVGVGDLREADDPDFIQALAAAGFPRVDSNRMDHPTDAVPDPSLWIKRFHGSCDPGRVAHVHVRELQSAGWQYALLFRDWLRADEDGQADYEAVKARLSAETDSSTAYAEAKAPWFNEVWPRMQAWAQRSGWHD